MRALKPRITFNQINKNLRKAGMSGVTLRYPYELRDPTEFFDVIPEQRIEPETLQLAHQLIRAKAGHFDAAEFEDRYEKALQEIIAAKQRGATVLRPAAAKAAPQVINLMDALKKSVREAAAGSTAQRKPQPVARPSRKPSGAPSRVRRTG